MHTFLEEELLRRKNKVIVTAKPTDTKIKKVLFSALKYDLMILGYRIGDSLEKRICMLSKKDFKAIYEKIVFSLKELLGDNKSFSPLFDKYYNSSDSNGLNIPKFEVKENLIELTYGTKEDVDTIFKNLLSSKTNISDDDKDFIKVYLNYYKDFTILPMDIPLKENVALLFSQVKHLDETVAMEIMKKYVNTATDVLRLAVSVVDGDLSLAEPCKFKLSNKERRMISTLLECVSQSSSLEEDMKRWENRWKRLGEVIHIGSKKHRYPNTYHAFDLIRNNPKEIKTFYRKIEILFESNNVEALVKLLSKRPGEFTRYLDLILRTFRDKNELILNEFEKVAKEVSSTVLLQAKGNFKTRDSKDSFRYFLPKGNVGKMLYTEDENRKFIDLGTLVRLDKIIEDALSFIYKDRPKYKNVLVSPELSNYLIPSSMRSSSKSKDLLTRGSRVKFEADKALRFFLWWVNNDSRVDIDLSAVALNDEFGYVTHIDYTQLEAFKSKHSGDFTDAPKPKGASEFIDIDIESFINNGARYVVMNVYSYTGQSFDNVECLAGLMEREHFDSDKVYDPLTVKHKYSLTGPDKVSVPMVIDLKNKEIIWTDMSLRSMGRYDSVQNNKHNVALMIKSIADFKNTKVNMLELIFSNLKYRAERIDLEPEEGVEYDLILEESFAQNLDEIMSNWL